MLSILLFVFGLIIGSFLAALTYRFPKGISIAKGRSFCTSCDSTISWFDNIPLLSYAVLWGKCRNCKRKISSRYPVIEFLTAILFVLVGPNLYLLLLSTILVSIFVIDFENMIIPDKFVFIGLGVAVLYLLENPSIFYLNLLTGIFSALLFLSIYFITLGRGMGLGDVKLALLMGSILGPNSILVWLFASFITGGIVATYLLIAGKAKLKARIAFGPFLIIGFFIAVFASDKLIYLFG